MAMFEPPQEISFEMAEEQRDEALAVSAEGGTRYAGMTYEDGVAAALNWLLAETPEPPMELDRPEGEPVEEEPVGPATMFVAQVRAAADEQHWAWQQRQGLR